MKSFDLVNRRTHLYLGLFVMPWLMMYGLSSLMLSHPGWFPSEKAARWEPVFERKYEKPIPGQANLRVVADDILKDCGLEGAFWAERPSPAEIRISRFRVRDETRVVYSIRDQTLRADRQQLSWNQVLQRLHFRGGFQQPSLGDDLWAVLVDVCCAAILIWIASGILMWWRLTRLRFWGAVALSGGILSFLLLIWLL